MTGQLLRVTTTPYQSLRFSQSSRLVSSDSVDLERRKAIARMRAFQSQHASGSTAASAGYDFVNQINRTFSVQSAQQPAAPSAENAKAGSAQTVSSEEPKAAASASAGQTVSAEPSQAASADMVSSSDVQANLSMETSSAYTMERGAFEFRVATGEVAFLPSLTMTVMTQRPEVHFEYLGGHNYVPPEKFADNGFMNLLA